MRKESDTQSNNKWEVIVAKSFEEIEAIRQIWEQMQAAEHCPEINADIDRYLSAIKTMTQDVRPYIMLIKQNCILVSMVIGQLKNTRIKCNLGRMTLFKPLLRELVVVYGGVLGNQTDEIHSLLIRELMNVLRRGEVDVLLFNRLKTDSSIYHIARKVSGLFCRSHFSKVEQHWRMSIPESIDQFLETCSHNSRRNFRRWTRKLEQEFPGQIRMVTYCQEDEVAEAIKIVADISANTYQRAFGGGLVDDAPTRAIFKAAAKKGWLRIYILFIADEPCAFWTTLKYGRTHYAEFTAYSPKWKDLHIGSILFFKILEQICGDPMVDSFDFGFGDGQHKRWSNSRQWPEASVLIFAPRPFPLFVNLFQSSTLAISILVQQVITMLGIRNFIQRCRRRRITRKNGCVEPQSVVNMN